MSQPADVDVDNKMGGRLPGGDVARYQIVRGRARVGYATRDGNVPFQTNFGAGPQPETAATYDAVTVIGEQVGSRHIDPYGNVMDVLKMLLVDWYWKLDGCPMPLTLEKIAEYQILSGVIRPWPVGFAGAMPGEPTGIYPAFPPKVPTPLSVHLTRELPPQPEFTSSVPPVHTVKKEAPPLSIANVNETYAAAVRASMAPRETASEYILRQIPSDTSQFPWYARFLGWLLQNVFGQSEQ
jgi:hypothetical protein